MPRTLSKNYIGGNEKNRTPAPVPFFYDTTGGILGSEEFVDEMIHRIGEFDVHAAAERRRSAKKRPVVKPNALLAAVEFVCDVPRADFCGTSKSARSVLAKETLVVAGRRLGASTTLLSNIMGLSSASVSRRHDSALRGLLEDKNEHSSLIRKVVKHYERIVG